MFVEPASLVVGSDVVPNQPTAAQVLSTHPAVVGRTVPQRTSNGWGSKGDVCERERESGSVSVCVCVGMGYRCVYEWSSE